MNEQLNQLIAQLTELLAGYGMNVIGAVLTLVIGFAAASWLSRMADRAMRRAKKIDAVFHPLPGKVIRIVIMIFTLVAVLNRFGIQTTSLIALLGAAGLAIGLALQGTLSNVAAGVMILMFRPFHIGDTIKLGSDVYVIDQLGFFVCRAHLPDGPTVILPNSKIWGRPSSTCPSPIKTAGVSTSILASVTATTSTRPWPSSTAWLRPNRAC